MGNKKRQRGGKNKKRQRGGNLAKKTTNKILKEFGKAKSYFKSMTKNAAKKRTQGGGTTFPIRYGMYGRRRNWANTLGGRVDKIYM